MKIWQKKMILKEFMRQQENYVGGKRTVDLGAS